MNPGKYNRILHGIPGFMITLSETKRHSKESGIISSTTHQIGKKTNSTANKKSPDVYQ